MKRRRSREYALQILFQIELTGSEPSDELLSEFWEGINEDSNVKEFTRNIVKNTIDNLEEIDHTIKKAARHWSIDRMAAIDRNILRAATYELLYRADDIPSSVAINEAIEIAKKYSTEDSAPFINGILDNIANSLSKPSGSKEKYH